MSHDILNQVRAHEAEKNSWSHACLVSCPNSHAWVAKFKLPYYRPIIGLIHSSVHTHKVAGIEGSIVHRRLILPVGSADLIGYLQIESARNISEKWLLHNVVEIAATLNQKELRSQLWSEDHLHQLGVIRKLIPGKVVKKRHPYLGSRSFGDGKNPPQYAHITIGFNDLHVPPSESSFHIARHLSQDGVAVSPHSTKEFFSAAQSLLS